MKTYSRLNEIIMGFVGINGMESSRLNHLENKLNSRNFLECFEIIEENKLITTQQKDFLKNYIDSFKLSC